MSADADLKKFDALFKKWKTTNPGGTFSQFTIRASGGRSEERA